MPVCVHCGTAASDLYMAYGTSNIILCNCSRCSRTVDPYVEYEGMTIFLDLLLLKRPAYRHLLFNRYVVPGQPQGRQDNHGRAYKRGTGWRGLLLVSMIDVYMKWSLMPSGTANDWHSFRSLCAVVLLQNLVFHMALRKSVLCYVRCIRDGGAVQLAESDVSSALLLSSLGKFFVAAFVIWNYWSEGTALALGLFVLCSNTEAIGALSNAPSWVACALILVGYLMKYVLEVLYCICVDAQYPIRWL